MNTVDVRGHLALTRPASVLARGLARLIDFALIWALFCAVFHFSGITPALHWWWLPALLALAGLYGTLFGLGLKLTPGELARGLRAKLPPGEANTSAGRGKLYEPEHPSLPQRGFAIVLTVSSVLLAGALTKRAFLEHPYWRTARESSLTPFLPPLQAPDMTSAEGWTVLPFYFTVGAWPTRFGGQPVFYSLPYEKGPPARFVGRIQARWNPPHALLWFEGPKTPPALVHETYEKLRLCLTVAFPLGSPRCWGVREAALSRHVAEMRSALGPIRSWDLEWFTVETPAIPDPERARGFFLRAEGAERGQDRAILITSRGTHQAFILEYSRHGGADHERARELLTQSIRSLRTSEELAPGRAWTDRQLQDTRLAELQTIRDPDLLMQRLADIQALLLAKLSVDPKTYDTYYHLGGISLTLYRRALAHPDKLRSSEWAAIAKPMIQSAHSYAKDVGPEDRRTHELLNFLLEANKR